MSVRRRLTAVIAAASLGWVGLAAGVETPVAQAAGPGTRATAPADRAPQDPATYYAGTDGLVGADLANKLTSIIKGHTTVNYATVFTAMDVLDRDPNNSANVIDFYSGTSVAASNKCSSSCPSGSWNREHTWPQSHGNFGTTNGPGTDLHHMRPEFATTNSSRGNLDFDNTVQSGNPVPLCSVCTRDADSFEPRDAAKGDLARGLFYMAVRYDGTGGFPDFKMNDRTCNGSGPANLGKLSTLVSWSLADPPDAGERARNDLVDDVYQHNRNPFIDHPEWVTSIYGDGVGLGPACGSTSGSDTLPGGGGPANTAPTTSPTAATTAEDTGTTVPLVASDADGDALTWTIAQAPSHGTASIAGATLSYAPTANYFGSDVVGVTVSDGRGGTASTTVSLTVTSVNDVPSAFDAAASTPRNTAQQVALSGSDADGDALTYAIVSQPARGTVTVEGSTATYLPATDYTGSDSFTYRAGDGTAQSAPATVSVAVTAAGQSAPTATPLSVETPEDRAAVFPLTGTDPDGDPITFVIDSHPTRGTLVVSRGQATYTPAPDVNGADSFTFTASDATETSAPATASITVLPVDDAPVAMTENLTTLEDTTGELTLSATDVDGDPLTYAIATQPAHGSVSLSGTQATYTPARDYNRTDSFTWTVSDGVATVIGSTAITVTPVNDAPSAGAVSSTTDEDGAVTIPLAGSDLDGDALSYALGASPVNGSVVVAGATATYTPTPGFNGQDTFTYSASDADLTSGSATVTVTVTPVNHPPTISAVALQTTAGTPVSTTLAATDVDGDPVTIESVTRPEHGTVTFSGLTMTYTPSTRSGTETFIVTVKDGKGGTAAAQVGVEITARTALLVASAARLTRGSASTVTIAATGPAGPAPSGTVTLTADGSTLGSGRLGADGTADLSVTPRTAGVGRWVVSYAGDDLFAPATSSPASVTVARSRSRLIFSSGTLRHGRPGVVRVAVRTVDDTAATGKIRLTVGQKNLTARATRGVATFKIATLPEEGKLKVSARYVGDTQYGASSARHTYRLKR